MNEPLAALYSEHRSIAAVLSALETLVRQSRDRRARIDPKIFRAMLYYLDIFAEREHHPKKEMVLFPMIRRHARDSHAILDELDREHEKDEHTIRDLEQAFLHYEADKNQEFASFAEAAERFVGRYRKHMRKKEREVMPLARRVL